MTYACSAWELEADRHLSFAIARLAWLESVKVPPTRDFHVDLKLSCLYDFMTELCSLKAEAIQNHKNTNVRSTGQGEVQVRNWRVNFGCGHGYVAKTAIVFRR
jgi:hypothetical protein